MSVQNVKFEMQLNFHFITLQVTQ